MLRNGEKEKPAEIISIFGSRNNCSQFILFCLLCKNEYGPSNIFTLASWHYVKLSVEGARETLQKTMGFCFLVPVCWFCRLLQNAPRSSNANMASSVPSNFRAHSSFSFKHLQCTLAWNLVGCCFPLHLGRQFCSIVPPVKHLSMNFLAPSQTHSRHVPEGKLPGNSVSAAEQWLPNNVVRQGHVVFSNEAWISVLEVGFFFLMLSLTLELWLLLIYLLCLHSWVLFNSY